MSINLHHSLHRTASDDSLEAIRANILEEPASAHGCLSVRRHSIRDLRIWCRDSLYQILDNFIAGLLPCFFDFLQLCFRFFLSILLCLLVATGLL